MKNQSPSSEYSRIMSKLNQHSCVFCTPKAGLNGNAALRAYVTKDHFKVMVACRYCVSWHSHQRPGEPPHTVFVEAGCRRETPYSSTGYYIWEAGEFNRVAHNRIHRQIINVNDGDPLVFTEEDGLPVLAAYRLSNDLLRFWCVHCDAAHYAKSDGTVFQEGAKDACHEPSSPYATTGYVLFVVGYLPEFAPHC